MNRHRRAWTERELEDFRRLYPTESAADLSHRFGRSRKALNLMALKLGIKKAVFISQFSKGCEAWNKGLKNSTGTSATRFACGSKPQTWRPIGSESVTKEGLRTRKVSDTGNRAADWRRVHELEWEAVNGPIPCGHILVRKDKRLPPSLDNLVLVNRAQLMKRNSVHTNYQPEVARLSQLRGALNRQINARTRAMESK